MTLQRRGTLNGPLWLLGHRCAMLQWIVDLTHSFALLCFQSWNFVTFENQVRT